MTTNCSQLIALFFQARFHDAPIFCGMTCVRLISQHADHINNGEIPLFVLLIPSRADRLILEKLQFVVAHFFSSETIFRMDAFSSLFARVPGSKHISTNFAISGSSFGLY